MSDFDPYAFSDNNNEGPSPQFYLIISGLLAAFVVCLFVGVVLVVKLRAMPQPGSTATAAASTAVAAAPSAGASIFWEGSYESALETARQTNKPVMIDFYTDWCGACKYLESETFPNSQVVAESQNFVNVRVNAEVRTDLAQQFGVNAYPTIVFLDPGGNLRKSFSGGYPPDDFVQEMQSARL